ADHQSRAGQRLHLREAARMVVMRLRIQEDLDVADLESQFCDVCLDERHRRLVSRIEQDVSLIGGDQIRPDIRSADEVHVVRYPIWSRGSIVGSGATRNRKRLSEQRSGERKKQRQQGHGPPRIQGESVLEPSSTVTYSV